MNKQTVIKNLLSIPKNFQNGDKSIYSLILESGYNELRDQISEMDILKDLSYCLECIDQWMRFSEDNRSTTGWYFKKNKYGKYIVGYSPSYKNFKIEEFTSANEACSVFIKRYIEEIRAI